MLSVFKASAGSGKTFQLVVEYLKLLISNQHNYRHILAVTFTNKATSEMKTRILETLNDLASGKPSAYIAEIQKEMKLSEEEIREKAAKVLKNILHDYNRFSISTIDSFTQRTIKAFNRELGITPNYKLEINSDIILNEATDRLFAKIDKDKNLLTWLMEFSKEQIEDNKSQRIENSIKSLGNELFKEKFQMFFPDEKDAVYNRENLLDFGKELKTIKRNFERQIKTLGKKGVEIIANNGLVIDDFSGKKNGAGSLFSKYESGKLKEVSKTAENASNEIEKWFVKNSPKKEQIRDLATSELQPLLLQIVDFIDKNEEAYFSADAVLKELRTLGILTDLRKEIKNLLHEKGLLQLSDSNLLLSKIIGNSDSPFIYEKTGTYFNHFMLDEFQDTSILQWNNFKPLILNALAEGKKNLLVGDVKQSIYRWRNSDYKILAEKIYSDFNSNQLLEFSLDKNWRSDKNIISFNNRIFENLKEIFEGVLMNETNNETFYLRRFQSIYNEISQNPGNPEKDTKGLVKVSFLEAGEFEDNSAAALVEEVKMLQDKGIKAAETAILIRKNKEGTPILEAFMAASKLPENKKYNLSVLSNESLFLISSQAVLTIIDVINLIISPDKEIAKVSLVNHWENWLKPSLKERNKIPDNTGQDGPADIFETNPEIIYQNELEQKIEELNNKIILTSLDEAIIQICSVFQLFEIETELPFIQTLIDKAGELKSSLSNDLSNFMFWWNENGHKTSVNVNEETDSIRLMTVHKSKGLEFRAVLIPYFNWELNAQKNFQPILWCEPGKAPFNRFPLLPVKYSSALEKTIFSNYYYDETSNHLIDTFNLAYVAFTRAKSALIIHSPKMEEKKPGKNASPKKNVQTFLSLALEKTESEKMFENGWNDDRSVFQYGTLQKAEKKEETSGSVRLNKYHFNDFGERIKLRYSGEDFLMEGENKSIVKNKGKIIHKILSTVNHLSDIERSCSKAIHEGMVDETEMLEIKKTIEQGLKHPVVAEWFGTKYKVINERNLLTVDRMLRPDRIMIFENEAVVVDYKSGNKKSETYNQQVKRYARVLKNTGFEKVKGYLWYINLNEVEEVCEF